MGFYNQMRDYMSGGTMAQLGYDPVERLANGGTIYEGFSTRLENNPGKTWLPEYKGQVAGWDKMSKGKAAMTMAPQIAGFAFTGYAMYQGYQEDGLTGLKDAFVWDMAMNAGVNHWAFASPGHRDGLSKLGQTGIKQAGTMLKDGGLMRRGARTIGAGIGASIGQAVGGTPGAFIGGYIGAAPFSALARHPMGVGAAIMGAGAIAAGYGTYQILKQGGGAILEAGRQHTQSKRGIDTSGSISAHMTQGANTMRSRAVQAMHKSHLNARSALGQEAGLMHYPAKNYHSRYR